MLREILLADDSLIRIQTASQPLSGHFVKDEFDREQTFKSAKAKAVARFEKAYLGDLLAKTRGNISAAARISQKDRSALNKLVKKHGLGCERFRTSSS
jgi:DNA-binding NtrC family response regulator